ncbi:MAG: hypothetical protein LBI36_04380 [Oscillospiraceae bacterium]|jgi:hypothetical protein|nr:hypothetical protein [Oscillospiraceae bacterium]
MFTVEQLQALKKGNIGVDADKVRQRIPEAYKNATTKQKEEIAKLSGLSKFTFYGVNKSGSASPKAVIALAQIMDISPHYLTGEIDSKEPCNAAVLAEFFNKCQGSSKKAEKIKVKATPVKVKPAVSSKPEKSVKRVNARTKSVAKTKKPVLRKQKAEKVLKPVKATAKPQKSVVLDDAMAVKLLEALFIRAKYDKAAAETYAAVTGLLLK